MNVEIWSDVACPWCYIGKRRFESALAEFAHRDEVKVTWRSYQLDPGAPRDSGKMVNEILSQKYGVSLSQAAAMNERVSGIAVQEGLEYHLEQAQYTNTFDAHRLIHLAATHGLQQEAEESFFHAAWGDGVRPMPFASGPPVAQHGGVWYARWSGAAVTRAMALRVTPRRSPAWKGRRTTSSSSTSRCRVNQECSC